MPILDVSHIISAKSHVAHGAAAKGHALHSHVTMPHIPVGHSVVHSAGSGHSVGYTFGHSVGGHAHTLSAAPPPAPVPDTGAACGGYPHGAHNEVSIGSDGTTTSTFSYGTDHFSGHTTITQPPTLPGYQPPAPFYDVGVDGCW